MRNFMRVPFLAWLLLLSGASLGGWGWQTTLAQPNSAGSDQHWVLKGDHPIVIGGYGDNFDWSGQTIRPLRGFVALDVDAATGSGTIEATLYPTERSGPLFFSQTTSEEKGVTVVKREYFEGEIRLVMHIDPQARLVQNEWLHGDTGREAPVLPDVFNFLAGWPATDLYVNGELAYAGLAGHFMFAEQLRRADGSIRNEDGEVYSMSAADKSHFTLPGQWELHLMAMSMDEPDPGNFPPFAKVLHVNFENLFVIKTPTGTLVPQSR